MDKKNNKILLSTYFFNIFIVLLSFLLYAFVIPFIFKYDYMLVDNISYIFSLLIIPSLFMGIIDKKYLFFFNLISYFILSYIFNNSLYTNYLFEGGFLTIRFPIVEAIYWAVLFSGTQKICYIIKEKLKIPNTKKICIILISVIICIFLLYEFLLFIEYRSKLDSYDKQLALLEDKAEISFIFKQKFHINSSNIYIDIDDMKMQEAWLYNVPIEEYIIEPLTSDKFNIILKNSDMLSLIYNTDNNMVYNLEINPHYFIFIISYKNEYYIVKETNADFIINELNLLLKSE